MEREIKTVLPTGRRGGHRAGRGQRADQQHQPGAVLLRTALLVFAFISLFVGGFTIFNTFSITVGQRTRELALLRIVGASRKQVFRSVLAEAFLIGLLASLVGLGLGVLAAVGLEALLKGFGIALPVGPLVFEGSTAIVGLLVGVGVTVVSAISPARRAVRIPPVAALSDFQATQGESSRRRITIGSVVAVLGIVALRRRAHPTGDPAGGIRGGGPVHRHRDAGARRGAPDGQRARPACGPGGRDPRQTRRENSMRSPRTAQTASALMVGLALVSTIAVFGASLSKSATASVQNAISADYIITSSTGPGGFSTSAATVAARMPGVTAARRCTRASSRSRHTTGSPPCPPRTSPRRSSSMQAVRASGPRRRPAASRLQHGQVRPPGGRFRGAGQVRQDRCLDHEGRRDLQAQRPHRELRGE